MCVFSRFLFVFTPNKHVCTQIFAYPEVSKLVVARLMGFSQNSFTPAILSIISVTIQCKQTIFSFCICYFKKKITGHFHFWGKMLPLGMKKFHLFQPPTPPASKKKKTASKSTERGGMPGGPPTLPSNILGKKSVVKSLLTLRDLMVYPKKK